MVTPDTDCVVDADPRPPYKAAGSDALGPTQCYGRTSAPGEALDHVSTIHHLSRAVPGL